MPYNPFLTAKYNAHINVQVCTSIRAVKYLYKYIHKGHGRAAVVVAHDEVQEFLDAHYVGPCESCWRLFAFDMHSKSHVVERLDVHLPGQHCVLFDEDDPQAAVQGLATAHTKLTAYFELVKAGWRADGERAPGGDPLC